MIRLDNISFGYRRGMDILSGFSMEIPDGGRVCLFGRSGCGKSTVLRLAMGLSRPGSGRITGAEGLSVSAVFQEDRLIPWKTVLENVALFAAAPKRAGAEREAAVGGRAGAPGAEAAAGGRAGAPGAEAVPERAGADESPAERAPEAKGTSSQAASCAAALLHELGLGGVLHSLPGELSGGMKRRAALARALAHPFDLLILDEPFTGLDEAAKRNAIALVNREARGKMLLLATHDLQEAEALQAKIMEL